MPAGLMKNDTMMSVRETPWHGLGTVLKKHPQTIEEALTLSGLDWEVKQIPVKITIGKNTKKIVDDDGNPRYFANIRMDTEEALGIVSARYTPVQNRSAFEFLAGIFGTEMLFETAGSLMDGRRVWVMMKIPDYIEVGGDPIGQYAFISNSHDGKSSVLAAMTPIRIVCQNTLGAAVRRAKGSDAARSYTLRHLGDMDNKIAEARNVLDVTVNYYKQFAQVGDKMAGVKLTSKKADSLLEQLLPTEGLGDRAAENRQQARDTVRRLFHDGTVVKGVSTVGASPGTVWSFYNAATEYADWNREERKIGGRFQRNLDDPDGLKNRAWEVSLQAASLA